MEANLGRMDVQKTYYVPFAEGFCREEANLPAKHVEDRKHGLKKSHCPLRETWLRRNQ